jgi:hypothetical protein
VSPMQGRQKSRDLVTRYLPHANVNNSH